MASLASVLRNTAILLVGTAGSKALVFVSTLVITRALGPEDFGRYSLVFAYLAFFELIADGGLDALAVRDASRGEPATARRLGDAIVLRGLAIGVAIPIALLVFPRVSDDPRDLPLVAFAGATLIASNRRTSLARLFEIPFRVRLDMGLPTLLGAGSEALHLALLPLLLAAGGATGAAAAQAIAPLPFAIVLGIASVRRLRPALAATWSSLRDLARAAAPLLGIIVLNVILVRVDVIMLRMMRGAEAVGFYSAPVRLVETANLLPALLMVSVFPLMARAAVDDRARLDRLFRESLRACVAVLGPVVALEILYAEPLLVVLFGRAYAPGSAALVGLALAEFLIFADVVVTCRYVAAGQEKRNLVFVGSAAVANVGLNLALVPAWGIAGAAWATLLSYLLRLVAALAFRDTRAVGIATFAAILPASLAAAVAFGPLALAPVPKAWAAGLGVLLYPFLLAGFRGFPPAAERAVLRDAIVRASGRRPSSGVAETPEDGHNSKFSSPEGKDSA